MNVPLVRDQAIVDVIAGLLRARGRDMPENNARQADVPAGRRASSPRRRAPRPASSARWATRSSTPFPGVPYEMAEMFERAILPDLRARMAEAGEDGVIASRVLRTWGASESALAEALQDRIDALDAVGRRHAGLPRLGHRGDQGPDHRPGPRRSSDVTALLDKEDAEVRRAIGARLGDIVFGVDDESMEDAVAARLLAQGLTFGVAESLTGGLIASRLVNVPGARAGSRAVSSPTTRR